MKSGRRSDLDLLYALSCFAVFLAHVLLIFAPYPYYHLKNSSLSTAAGVVYEFIRTVSMTLFFLLAGWSSVASLHAAGTTGFLRKRLTRLFVPFLTGFILFCPIIKYIELLDGRDLSPSGMRLVPPIHMGFFKFVPLFYTRLDKMTWSHLWFLAYLLLISLIFLPALLLLTKLDWKTGIDRLPGWSAYLPFIPLALWLTGLHGWWPFYPNLIHDWVNFFYFAFYFLIGAVMKTCPAFERCIQNNWKPMAIIGAAAFVGLILTTETDLGRSFVAITTWGCTCSILGAAFRFRPIGGKTLKYFRDASLPIYVIHHVLVLGIGWYVIHLKMGVALKIAILAPTSGLLTVALYEGVVRRLSIPRLLLGMPPLPKAAPSVGHAAIAVGAPGDSPA